jgi:hypothetical protein
MDDYLVSFYTRDLTTTKEERKTCMKNVLSGYIMPMFINVFSYSFTDNSEKINFEIFLSNAKAVFDVNFQDPDKITITFPNVKITSCSLNRELSITSIMSLILHLDSFDFFPMMWETKDKWSFLEKLIGSCLKFNPISFSSVGF